MQETMKDLLDKKLIDLQNHFDADIFTYYGPIAPGAERIFLSLVEELAVDDNKKESIYVILTTGGGSAETVERFVNILRHYYSEVNFIVPDYAYSAGTIFCMSGDNIHMDFYSVLGPIDPQVQNREGKWVAALGYLDKINQLMALAKSNKISQAEFIMLKDFDLAELRSYEMAKELTVSLLKNWLVNYKFKNWATHETTPATIGQPVTAAEKEARAEEIANKLGDNNIWKSHGRPINVHTLTTELKLKIEDYSNIPARRELITSYYELLTDYIERNGMEMLIHTKLNF